VLTSSTLFAGLGLGSEWERPTVELSALRRASAAPPAKGLLHRSLVSGRALGAAVVAGLTVGIAVLAFGAANRTSPEPLTASGSMQPVDQGAAVAAARAQVAAEPGAATPLAEATPVPSIVGNPALALAPNARENLKLRPLPTSKDAKKTKKPQSVRAPDADPVRLPPSGL
jgi:hypothetical protein